MRNTGEFRYYFTTSRWETCPNGWARLSEDDFQETAGRIERLPEPAGPPPVWAQDLLRLARLVYLADKKAVRDGAVDKWTRSIDLSIPLREPNAWAGQPTHDIHALLGILTSDVWRVTLRPHAPLHSGVQGSLDDDWRAEEVGLLSGGLDSTAYAAHAARRDDRPLLLVTFLERKLKKRQEEIFRQIKAIRPRDVRQAPISQTPMGSQRRSGRRRSRLELSARSRGLLYTATAVYAAAAHGTDTVSVPENGLLAVNPPLNPSRLAACSTRAVHPATLSLINALIKGIGGSVCVVNPLLEQTKGEVCRLALDAGLSPDVLERTVSCAHPPINRLRGGYEHCGRCFACLVRRSGLHHALGEDHTRYQERPWNLPVSADFHIADWAQPSCLESGAMAGRHLDDLVKPSHRRRALTMSLWRSAC